MATQVSGARSTGNVNSDRVVVPFDKQIALIEPKAGPLTTLTRRLKGQTVDAPKFSWTEDELCQKRDYVNGAQSAAEATVNCDTAAAFRDGDLVKVPRTGEVMEVTADGVAANGYIAVTRGIGSSPSLALEDDDELLIIGNRNAEGATARTAFTTVTTTVYQYTQILRWPFQITETAKNTKMVDQPDLPYQRKKALIEHKAQLERASLFGERAITGSTTTPDRCMRGVLETITTNVKVLASPGYLTEDVFDDWLIDLFRYGSDTRWIMVSPLIGKIINAWGKSKVKTSVMTKKYGMAIREYLAPQGTVYIVINKELEGTTYGGYAIALDFADGCVRWCHIANRDTHLKKNIQAADADKEMDEYLTEGAPKVKQEKRHGLLKGVKA